MKSHYAIIAILAFFLSACKKDNPIHSTTDTVKEDYLVCAQDSWVSEQDFPASYRNIYFTYNNKVYVPNANDPDIFDKRLYVYDGSVWEDRGETSPTFYTTAVIAFFTIGSKGYVITENGSGSASGAGWMFYEYNILTNNWTRKADFPGEAEFGAAAFTVNGKCYVAGGYHQLKYINDVWVPPGYSGETWEYNPATNVWTRRHNLPLKRAYAKGFSLGNKGYIANGKYPDDLGYLRGLLEYNPATDRWTSKALMPGEGRTMPAVLVIDGVAYAGGGKDEDDNPQTDFYQYSVSNDSWTRVANIPLVDYESGMFTINGKGYVIYKKGTWPYIPSDMKRYNPKYCVNINNAGTPVNGPL